MTRKDYILIAEVLRIEYHRAGVNWDSKSPSQQYHDGGVCDGILGVAKELADSLGRANPRFDREHFLAVVRGEKDLNSRPGRP